MMEISEIIRELALYDDYIHSSCNNCAFVDKDEWEMPCKKCKRNCKDYWRPGEEKENDKRSGD